MPTATHAVDTDRGDLLARQAATRYGEKEEESAALDGVPTRERNDIDVFEANIDEMVSAEALELLAGGPESTVGLPQGLRMRTNLSNRSAHGSHPQIPNICDGGQEVGGSMGLDMLNVPLPRTDVWILRAIFLITAVVSCHLIYQQITSPESFNYPVAPPSDCRQCNPGWWHSFWLWRFAELARDASNRSAPPAGMEWEWSNSGDSTDWFNASAEMVGAVVAVHVDPNVGPLLHIGCGDSPMPSLLHGAGFHYTEHLDISSDVISKLRERYPASKWPGMRFEVRDFLGNPNAGGGAPPPAHRFSAVIDKAGIWDWLQEEAEVLLPGLLAAVRRALVEAPVRGKYIIATKQTPIELSDTLARIGTGFTVDVTRPLGSSGIAFAYVLSPS